jgi:acyl-CoA hydrolase
MDIAAAVCAQTHSEKICVTACINNVDFKSSAKIGDIINISANITRAFTTFMEIFVQAFARKVLTGKKYLISEAYFTFVMLDKNGKAVPVIGVKPVTTMEKELFDLALNRKSEKKISRKRIHISI